jgi:hypothetical protein
MMELHGGDGILMQFAVVSVIVSQGQMIGSGLRFNRSEEPLGVIPDVKESINSQCALMESSDRIEKLGNRYNTA